MKKRSVLLIMLAALVALMAACGGQTSTGGDGNGDGDGDGNGDGQAKKKLIVGTDAAYPPFEALDPTSGEIIGFDIDLIKAVLAEAGYEYEIKNAGWDPLFLSLENGEIDLGISAVTINSKREESYDFTAPYFESAQMMLFKEGTEISNALDLEGKKIGVQNGTTGQFAAEAILEELGYSTGEMNDAIRKYDSTPVAIMALEGGELDVVVIDHTVAEEYVKNNPGSQLIAIGDRENFDPEFYGIIFKKGSSLVGEFNTALKTVIENGTYSKIYEEWFGYEPNVESLLNKQ